MNRITFWKVSSYRFPGLAFVSTFQPSERAKAAGVSMVVFDRGGFIFHGRVKALADGAREGGLEF